MNRRKQRIESEIWHQFQVYGFHREGDKNTNIGLKHR